MVLVKRKVIFLEICHHYHELPYNGKGRISDVPSAEKVVVSLFRNDNFRNRLTHEKMTATGQTQVCLADS